MFIVTRKDEKIIKLEKKNDDAIRENIKLMGQINDIQDEILRILDNIEKNLTRNDYDNPRAKIAITLEYLRKEKNIILEDKKIELDDGQIN